MSKELRDGLGWVISQLEEASESIPGSGDWDWQKIDALTKLANLEPAELLAPFDDEDLLEAAYWRFDTLLGRQGEPYKSRPQSERDAFKSAVRQLVHALDVKREMVGDIVKQVNVLIGETPTTVTCPQCTRESKHPLMPASAFRRCARYHDCECGAVIRLGTREGWERWYALDWAPSPAEIRTPRRLPDYDAFYERLGGEARKL